MEAVGTRISASQNIEKKLEEVVKELGDLESGLTDVKGPTDGLSAGYEKALQEVAAFRGRPLYFPYIGSGAGKGAFVELADGSVKLDLINGIGVHILGHSHPRVTKAMLRGALSDIVNQGNLQPNEEYLRLGKKLVSIASKNSRIRHSFLTTCGSRANEKALSLVRQKNEPAHLILSFEKAFAGRTAGVLEITDNPGFKQGLPVYNEALRLPFFDRKNPGSTEKTLEKMKEYVGNNDGKIAAFCFEPIQGEGGFRDAPKEFFVPLFEFCKSKGIAIWADEIQTFMRTGQFFAYETLGIGEYIDICTVAKVLQVAAVMYTEEYNPKPGLIAGTFSGTSPALAAGYEILTIMEEGGYFGPSGKTHEIRKKFVGMLEDLGANECKGMIDEISGLGLMVAFKPLDGSAEKVQALLKSLFGHGLIAFSAGRDPVKIRCLLPAILSDHEISVARRIFAKSLKEVAG